MKMMWLLPLVILAATIPQAKAWDGGPWSWSGWYHQPYSNGYYAGQQDAIYDHDNNLAYNPIGQCLSCHSELYWNAFHHGYEQQWNSYQNQESTQGTSINIYGNNNYVNTNQYSGQNQQGPDSNPNCWGSCDGGPDP